MGTSQSAKGPLAKVSLVPSWADDRPENPLPDPAPKRFFAFRTNINKFINTGNESNLKKALGYYSRTTTGGSEIAARRLGNVTKIGARLFGFLNGSLTKNDIGLDINELTNLSSEEAIEKISNIMSQSEKGDSERIKKAMKEALTEALNGVDFFDPKKITEDIIVDTMINYLSENIFLQIVMDSSDMWNESDKISNLVIAENALKELIKVIVDRHISAKLMGDIRKFSQSKIIEIERISIIEVWREWEAYK